MTWPRWIEAPYCWVIDRLEQHPVATALLTSIGNIGGTLALSNWVDWKLPLQQQWKRFVVGALLTVASTGILVAVTQRTKSLRQRRETRKAIKKLLWMLASEFGYPERQVRTNVMMLTPDKTRRVVDKGTACNMDHDLDCDLSIPVHAGVSGLAVTQKKPALCDLADDEFWGMSAEEDAKVRPSLKVVLSVPIVHSEDGQQPELLGTLQVDSDLTKEQMGLDEGSIKKVERYADVCALHLRIL